MSERAPYSRVYWSVMDDDKFDGIREDVRLFGAWLILLVIADMAHPAPAYMPRTIPKMAISRLSSAGLIDLLAGHRYRIHGLDAERERRRSAATTRGPSGDRPVPKRSANGEQDEAETRRDENETRQGADDGRADLRMFLLIHRKAPSARQRQVLDGIVDRRDQTGPEWAADIMARNPDDAIGAVIKADKEWRVERIAEAQAAERPTPRPPRPRAHPESVQDLLDHWKRGAPDTAVATPADAGGS